MSDTFVCSLCYGPWDSCDCTERKPAQPAPEQKTWFEREREDLRMEDWPAPECIACKYSGSDEREYAAWGCPDHTLKPPCRYAEPKPQASGTER